MKQSWLFLGLAVCVGTWGGSLYFCIALGILMMVFHLRRFEKGHIIFGIFLVVCFVRMEFPKAQLPQDKVVKILEMKSNYVIATTGTERVILYNVKDVSFHDVLKVKGTYEIINSVHNFNGFYFKSWCQRRGIYYSLDCKEQRLLKAGTGPAHALFQKTQHKPLEEKKLLQQMLFGIHDGEDDPYFMTASGLHIATLWYGIRKILELFFAPRTCMILCMVGMGTQAWITYLSATILRILLFQLINFLFPSLDQKDRLGMSMVATLLIAPYMAWELAFLIPVAFRFISIFNTHRVHKTICTYFVLLPLQFLFLHKADLLSSFLLKPMRCLYACLYIYAASMLLLPLPVSFAHAWMNWLSICQSDALTLYFAAPLWWVFLWCQQVLSYLQTEKKHVIIALFLMISLGPCLGYFNPFFQIIMLDVGQGDCSLIIYPFQRKVVMIDVMGSLYKDVPKDIILPFLKDKQIHHIDTLIVTHADMDHSGGVKELCESIEVDTIIDSKAKAKNNKDQEIQFLENDWIGNNENENSLITYLHMDQQGILFMGDAGWQAERELMHQYADLPVTILKAGHHGSKTSSSPLFLHHYQPIIALISAGRHNRYGHPHQEVLSLMEKEGIYALTTAVKGSVEIEISKYFGFYRTADNEFGIIR